MRNATKPVPKFAIGDVIQIGDDKPEKWRVVRYHKIGQSWEVMLRSIRTGVHRSVAIKDLEVYV